MTLRSILQESDIVNIIKKFTILRNRGRYYKGICPFRAGEEIGEMLIVDRKYGQFQCKGCGASGDVLDFIMKIYDVKYDKAVEILENPESAEKIMKRFKVNLT